ncbi:Imm74 family immunity protein [Williamwhitmania taraxaci]|uniref:Immunity protein 74 n=1 Tax=Williamwhitmania taraxaci TaxID=1640674 RepID=A0A1G6TH26_9BACT|nr:Imm74 family immunity protein [Williamwhitmania taraxaci]SDD28373.1 Immunity protein 74 [Williamwhitmania taraxaci]
MELQYSILTPSKMLVEKGDKKILIMGEATLTPAFYADIKSIKKWESPYDKEEITEEEKTELIQRITEESQKEGNIRVYFE